MKRQQPLHTCLSSALLGLVLAGSTMSSQAGTTNYIVDQFDADTTATYRLWWGNNPPVLSWDTSVNATTSMAPNNPGSGSLKFVVDWSSVQDQYFLIHGFDGTQYGNTFIDLRSYTNLSFDILIDPSSGKTANGTSYGFMEIDYLPYQVPYPPVVLSPAGITLPITNNWIHVSLPISSTATGIGTISGIGFKMQAWGLSSVLTGVQTYWLDNVIFGANTNVIMRPTISLAPVKTPPGLTIVASGGGNDYKRGMIATLDPVYSTPYYSWVGAGDVPVTYSITITNYPDATHSAFQSEIFLVPNGGYNDSSIDYSAASVVFLDIQNHADGTASGTFRYKTNTPWANAMFYGSGALASLICSNGALGTWSMTFLNDTNVTLMAPGGGHTNFFLPDAATIQTLFANPLTAYFGNQQNGAGNAGQSSTYSRVRIAGVTLSPEIDETFPGPVLNPDPGSAKWQVVCDIPSDVFVMLPEDKYWVRWTVPDTGFSLQSCATLVGGSWADPGLTNIVITSSDKRVLVPASSLPSASAGFFRLARPLSP